MRNLITDVPGLKVGHAEDTRLGSGATAIMFDVAGGRLRSTCAAADRARARPPCSIRRRRSKASTRSRSPAARLSASMPPPACRAGSRSRSRGFAVRRRAVPIVPAAILFDLLSGGDKEWGRFPPYRELGYAAAAAAGLDFALGSVGAGARRHHRRLQGRPRLRLGAKFGRPHRRRARRRQCRRQRADRRRTMVLGGAVRARRRVRRARATSGVLRSRRSKPVHQGQRAARARRSSSSPPTPC